jgi:hypothetical protein
MCRQKINSKGLRSITFYICKVYSYQIVTECFLFQYRKIPSADICDEIANSNAFFFSLDRFAIDDLFSIHPEYSFLSSSLVGARGIILSIQSMISSRNFSNSPRCHEASLWIPKCVVANAEIFSL